MLQTLPAPPPGRARRPRRQCAEGRHAAAPDTVCIDGHNRRAICRWCKRPIVRAMAVGRWIVSGYLE